MARSYFYHGKAIGSVVYRPGRRGFWDSSPPSSNRFYRGSLWGARPLEAPLYSVFSYYYGHWLLG